MNDINNQLYEYVKALKRYAKRIQQSRIYKQQKVLAKNS